MTVSFSQEFIVKGRQKTILGAFPELTDAAREEFLPEYKKRVEAAHVPDEDGLYNLHFDGFLIFGEKLWREVKAESVINNSKVKSLRTTSKNNSYYFISLWLRKKKKDIFWVFHFPIFQVEHAVTCDISRWYDLIIMILRLEVHSLLFLLTNKFVSCQAQTHMTHINVMLPFMSPSFKDKGNTQVPMGFRYSVYWNRDSHLHKTLKWPLPTAPMTWWSWYLRPVSACVLANISLPMGWLFPMIMEAFLSWLTITFGQPEPGLGPSQQQPSKKG